MERYELEKLRDLPIEEVAQQLGLEVNGHHKALCPFHDDHHASLSFNARNNSCRCFVCMDHSLGTIDLVMRLKHVDFIVATRWLADRFGIHLQGLRRGSYTYMEEQKKQAEPNGEGKAVNIMPNGKNETEAVNIMPNGEGAAVSEKRFDASRYARFFEHPWLSDEARRFLFEERRLDERVVRWCRLSSWQDREGTHWLQTPYFDIGGSLIGIQNRNLDHKNSHTNLTDLTDFSKKKNAREQPRFRFPYGAKCGIYNLPVINRMKPGDELYITEGCSDCWAMLSAGHKAIAIPSATLLTPEDKTLLSELSQRLQIQWHMYPDRDAPGERLFLQLKELLPSLQHHQLPPGCKDFGEAYAKELKGR